MQTTADVVVRSRQKGEKVYKDVLSRLNSLTKRVAKFGAASVAAAAGGVAVLTAQSFRQVDVLAKHADRIGDNTIKLKTLNNLAELTGGSSENMSKSLLKATKALGEFNVTGSGTAAPFLRQLNFDTKELAKLKPSELFEVYAEKIRGLNTRSEQAAASAALFGDRTGEMLNIIDLGKDAFTETEIEVTRYGLALDRVDSAKVEAANDAMFRVQERAKGLGNVIASKVAPIITAMANRFLDSGTEADEMGRIVDRVLDSIAFGAGAVADAFFGWKIIFAGLRTVYLGFASGVVGSLANIEESVIIVGNVMRDTFGGDQIDPASGTLAKIEASLIASSKHAGELLSELAASEKPSVAIARALANARIEAQGAAEATAKAREKLQEISAPTFEENEVETKAKERAEKAAQALKDRLAGKLETVRNSLLEQQQVEAQAFLARREIIDNAIAEDLVSEEKGLALKSELRKRFEDKLTELAKKGLTDRLKFQQLTGKQQAQDVFGTLEQITAGVANSNKTLFRINQAAAIANAIINTHEGVTKTLAKYPWPLSGILAAAHLAAGIAQVSAIRSASFGGGTTPSLAGSTPTVNDQPVSNSNQFNNGNGNAVSSGPTIQIIVEGSIVSDENVKTLIKDTIGEMADDDVIVLPANSRNAEEIRRGTGSGG